LKGFVLALYDVNGGDKIGITMAANTSNLSDIYFDNDEKRIIS